MLVLASSSASIQIQRKLDEGVEVCTRFSSDEFFADCSGLRTSSLSIRHGEGVDEEFTFDERPYLLVGRSMLCDIRLNHNDVSYRHAYFQIWDGEVFYIDLASRTGTFKNDIARQSGLFTPGTSVRIGPYTISNNAVPSVAQSKASLASNLIPRQDARNLEIFSSRSSAGKKKKRSIRRPVTLIGNSPSCKIRLEDESISRIHCSLVLTSNGLWVVNLLGKDGIVVNGERVSYSRLGEGDELEIGKFRLILQGDDVEALENFDDSDEFEVESEERDSANTETETRRKPKKRSQRNKTEQSKDKNALSTENSVQLSVPVGPQQLNLSETFVLTLVEQFASMQQQILNQSNQHMMMMSQLFSTMHRSQQELIRDDLHRVHEISMELERLQHEMLKEKSLTLLTESRQIDEHVDSDIDRKHHIEEIETKTESADEPEKSAVVAPESLSEKEGSSKRSDVKTSDEFSEKEEQNSDGNDTEKSEPQQEDSQAVRENRKEKVSGGIHSHAWLTQRMGDLEKERTSHWKKIMKVLSRK